MSETDAERFREDALAAQAEEDRDQELRDWVERRIDELWQMYGSLLPWQDAGPEEDSSDDKTEGTAA